MTSLWHNTTILRWVQTYTPEFQKRWNRFARSVGGSWRCDETYIKVKGVWVYLYRAVDKAGKTVEFYLSRNRDVEQHPIAPQIQAVTASVSNVAL